MGDDADREAAAALVERLKALREQRGFSYDRMAELSGLAASTVRMMEKGRNMPTILTCLKVCDALGVRLSDLLREIGR